MTNVRTTSIGAYMTTSLRKEAAKPRDLTPEEVAAISAVARRDDMAEMTPEETKLMHSAMSANIAELRRVVRRARGIEE